MEDKFDADLCKEKHGYIKESLQDHETRLNEHEMRIVNMEKDGREFQVTSTGLIKKMDDFITTVKWGMGIFVTVSLSIVGILIKMNMGG